LKCSSLVDAHDTCSAQVVWDAEIKDPRVLELGFVPEATKQRGPPRRTRGGTPWFGFEHAAQSSTRRSPPTLVVVPRRRIYDLHAEDPDTWSFHALAQRYGISSDRVRAIVVLRREIVEMRARGEVPLGDAWRDEKGRTAAEAAEEMWYWIVDEIGKWYNVKIENKGLREPPEAEPDRPLTRPFVYTLDDDEDEDEARERAEERFQASMAQAIQVQRLRNNMGAKKPPPPPLETYRPPDAVQGPAPPASFGGPPYAAAAADQTSPTAEATAPAAGEKKHHLHKRKVPPPPKPPPRSGAIAIKDISKDPNNAPTFISLPGQPLRPATYEEDLWRSWSVKPRYVERMAWAQGNPNTKKNRQLAAGGTPGSSPPPGTTTTTTQTPPQTPLPQSAGGPAGTSTTAGGSSSSSAPPATD